MKNGSRNLPAQVTPDVRTSQRRTGSSQVVAPLIRPAVAPFIRPVAAPSLSQVKRWLRAVMKDLTSRGMLCSNPPLTVRGGSPTRRVNGWCRKPSMVVTYVR